MVLIVLTSFWRWQTGQIEQDGYLNYAEQIVEQQVSSLPLSETRLSPGLPVVISLISFFSGSITVSGYIVTITSFILSYWVLYQLTASKWSVLPLIFPPIAFDQFTQVSSESLFVAVLLTIIWLSQREKSNWLIIGLLSGGLIWIRLTGVIIIPWLVYIGWSHKKKAAPTYGLLGWLTMILALLGFNRWIFGPMGWFQQITIQQIAGRAQLSLWQLSEDLFRAWSSGVALGHLPSPPAFHQCRYKSPFPLDL